MCGIAGRLLKRPGRVGADLVDLLQAMRHRGSDSTGFALYGPPRDHGYVVRVVVADRGRLGQVLDSVLAATRGHGADFSADPTWDTTGQPHVAVRLEITEPADLPRWIDACAQIGGVDLQSVGRSLEIVKDLGDAHTVAGKHGIGDFIGTHGLGHVRLATESLVSPVAGHPFWARPFPDVAIVHNGQLTNYFTWRRRLEHLGYRFATENDSELIAVWNSVQTSGGATLADSLSASRRQLDGVFTYLLATSGQIGMAKDRWAIKPLVGMFGAGGLSLATEEQSVRVLHPAADRVVNYDGPDLVETWPVTALAGVAA